MNLTSIVLIVSFLWVASETALARARRSGQKASQLDKSSLRLLWISISASVSIGVVFGVQRVGYFGGGSFVYPIAGLALIVLGLLVRWIAILTLKRHFTVDVAIAADQSIVRDGIYRFVRHPAYAGSLLSFLGLGLFFGNYFSLLIIFLPICAAFVHRIRIEEKALTAHFGEAYTDYCASTKRLIPGIF